MNVINAIGEGMKDSPLKCINNLGEIANVKKCGEDCADVNRNVGKI